MPTADPAATVIVLRRTGNPFEVLLVRRNSRGFFGSLVVFPGGRVDDVDVPKGRTAGDDESHRRAALRELAEEAGLLVTADGLRSVPGHKGSAFYDWLESNGLALAGDRLELVSRWVTPEAAPRRFDTRFYVMAEDAVPGIVVDEDELLEHFWVTPREALEKNESGDWPMFLPTIAHLRWLSRRANVDEAISAAAGADGRTRILPQRMDDGSMLPIMMPAD